MSTLNFKPFYVHGSLNRRRRDSHTLRSQPHGFTVLVTPSSQERMVNMQVALCHYDDEFSKKMGRKMAGLADIKTVNARDLPHELVKLRAKIHHVGARAMHGEYDYILRYVV